MNESFLLCFLSLFVSNLLLSQHVYTQVNYKRSALKRDGVFCIFSTHKLSKRCCPSLESNISIPLTHWMLSKWTKCKTYRYSRWKSPAKASSRMTVNELEFSSLKIKHRLQCRHKTWVTQWSFFCFFCCSELWANTGLTLALQVHNLTHRCRWTKASDSFWLDFLVTSTSHPFSPVGPSKSDLIAVISKYSNAQYS